MIWACLGAWEIVWVKDGGQWEKGLNEGFLCGKNADWSERKWKLGKLEGASEVENWESTLDKENNGEATGGVGWPGQSYGWEKTFFSNR